MTDLSGTFGGFWDRITYVLAEAQILVAGVLFSLAVALIWFRPTLPGVPPIIVGWIAIGLLFGPGLFGFFVWGIKKLRQFRWETVYHINAATDEREKWFVKPAVWNDRTVEGPSAYRCNDDEDWEVREFDYIEETDTVTIRGSHVSQMQDSRLLTFKTLVFDLHDVFAEQWQEKIMARARETRRGLEQQEAVVNAQAEASERGLMEPRKIVSESWEESLEDLRENDDLLEIDEFETYAEKEHGSWSPDPIGPEPAPDEAATDGGENP